MQNNKQTRKKVEFVTKIYLIYLNKAYACYKVRDNIRDLVCGHSMV